MEEIRTRSPWLSEDVWSIWLGWAVLLAELGATWFASAGAERAINPLAPRSADLQSWEANPIDAFFLMEKRKEKPAAKNAVARKPQPPKRGPSVLPGVAGVFVALLALFAVGLVGMRERVRGFPLAFTALFALAIFAYLLAGQKVVKHYNLEYALWALAVGLLISNTVGTPRWLQPAVRAEFYIKTGLVMFGAEVLFHLLLELGPPGVCIAWVVTPTVLILTYLFGQHVLKIESKSLNMVISADMSVCGVSAAIATAAACRAKKEELSLAIGISLAFTVIMMVAMPPVIAWLELGPVLGGAWIGGTIDSTGAVAAAGDALGETGLMVATTVKMIQNILIGAVAFSVAMYWVTCVEKSPDGARPSLMEIWKRFPKFVLGFIAASILFSLLAKSGDSGEAIVTASTSTSKTLRGWCFCLAFVSIGLETNFRELKQYLVGGKPLILYVCGQALNLTLTLAMAWLMFTKVFPNAAAAFAD